MLQGDCDGSVGRISEAIEEGVRNLSRIYRNMSEYERELEWSIRLDLPWEGKGTGYVVDCLRSVFSGTSRDPGPTGYDPVWSHPMKVRRAHLEYLIRIASGG